MPIAAIGFFGSLFEATATAIGTGMVVGGFWGAMAGVINGWSREEVEQDSLRNGFIGAGAACTAWLVDLLVRYLLSA
jgi:hypothetical protein